jgi:hypothetical protein
MNTWSFLICEAKRGNAERFSFVMAEGWNKAPGIWSTGLEHKTSIKSKEKIHGRISNDFSGST